MSDENRLVPLSGDMELRPRGSPPGGLHQLLAPRLTSYLNDIDANLTELKRLAHEAREANNCVGEAAIRVKTSDLLLRLARLAEEAHSTVAAKQPRPEIRSQEDVPDFERMYTPEQQEKIGQLLDLLKATGYDVTGGYGTPQGEP